MRMFWLVATALLIWNLIGDAAYLSQVTADLDALAQTDPVAAETFRMMPEWVWAAYATAVWSGTAGAIALLLRRNVAWMLFAVSLIAVIVQFGWTFLGTGLLAQKGASAAVFPLVIAAIALFATYFARAKARDGTLR